MIRNQEFLLLPADELHKLLASDDVNVPDEESIFHALMMWVKHDMQRRYNDLSMLLAYIRLPLLPPQVNCGFQRACHANVLFSFFVLWFSSLDHSPPESAMVATRLPENTAVQTPSLLHCLLCNHGRICPGQKVYQALGLSDIRCME